MAHGSRNTLTLADTALAYLTLDDSGRILTAHPGGDRVPNLNLEELAGTPLTRWIPDTFHAPVESGLRQLAESGESWLAGQRMRLMMAMPDGDPTDVEIKFEHDPDLMDSGLTCWIESVKAVPDDDQRRLPQALLTAQHAVSPDGIIIVAPDGEILFYNQRYREIWGVPLELLESGSITEVRQVLAELVDDPEGRFLDGFRANECSREINRDEFKLQDGRILVRHSAPVISPEEELLGRFWSYRDVTATRHTEQRLNEQSEHLAALVNSNPDIVASLERDGTIVSINSSVFNILGYQPDEMTGARLHSFIVAEHEERIDANIDAVCDGLSQECEVAARHKNGSPVVLRVKLIPVSPDRDQIRFWIVATDTTEEKRATIQAKKVQTSLEVAQRIARLGSFEWHTETDNLYWSDGLYEIFGTDRESSPATFNSMIAFIHPEDQAELIENVQQTLQERSPYEMDVRIIRPDGAHRVLHAHGEVIVDEYDAVTGMVGTVVDITERKQEEDALQHLVSLLEDQARALEAKTAEQESFIYSVSHDLRSPIISIQGMAEILASDYAEALDDSGQMYLKRIAANVQRLQQMLNGLLELSRIGRTEQGSRHNINLDRLVADIVADLKDSERGRAAEIVVESELPVVRANHPRMIQLFSNLLDNAIKYTPPERTPRITVRSEDADGEWKLTISDNGIGIRSDQLSNATGMFARLAEGQRLNPSGSGLGLAIVSRIVSTHGGRLEFDSVIGEGTTITFTLPQEYKD